MTPDVARGGSAGKDLERRLGAILELLIQTLHPHRVILFGSRAKGTARPGSDIDLAIDGPTPSLREERQLKEAIDDAGGLYSVDLIFLDRADPAFRALIESTGKVLHAEKD